MTMYRQGDVLLVPIASIPPSAKVQDLEDGRVILAHGEVTGHAHAIKPSEAVDKLAEAGLEYLRVTEQAVDLTHEEHATIAVPPGVYKIVIQREYTPETIRRVLD